MQIIMCKIYLPRQKHPEDIIITDTYSSLSVGEIHTSKAVNERDVKQRKFSL